MFYSPDTSIDEFLVHGLHVLNYLDNQPEAQSLLARYGMDGTRLQDGKMLLTQVQTTHWLMRNRRRQQKASTLLFHTDLAQAKQLYRRHRQAARDVLGKEAGGLLQAGARAYASWLAQAQEFYAAMLNNPTYQEKLLSVEITAEQLLRASRMMNTLMTSKTTQTQNREGTRTSKQERDQQLSDAKSWFAVLTSIAQVAFRKQPGLLEAIYTLPEQLSKEQKEKKQARLLAAKQRKSGAQTQTGAKDGVANQTESANQTEKVTQAEKVTQPEQNTMLTVAAVGD